MKASIRHSVYVLITLLHASYCGPPLPPTIGCNSFPKIFGGNNGDTSVNQIDVFDDYLAFGGNI